MPSTSETGHAVNVAHFAQLKSYITSYGTAYNPSRAFIKLPAIGTLFLSAQGVMAAEGAAFNLYSDAVDLREAPFDGLNAFITRIIAALDSCEVTDAKVKDAKSYSRKIKGIRATPKKDQPVVDPSAPPSLEKESKQISASQLGYDNRLENFSNLVNLLSQETGYIPNEPDLKITNLNAVLAGMRTKNSAVIAAITGLGNARIARNDVLYKDVTGVHDIAMEVKKYVKSVYGFTSPQYKQVVKLKFTKPR